MILGTVTGRVVSTRKHDKLVGNKLLIVEAISGDKKEGIVAIDVVGAGIGETVLVVTGANAKHASTVVDAPIDAAIVGIVDNEV